MNKLTQRSKSNHCAAAATSTKGETMKAIERLTLSNLTRDILAKQELAAAAYMHMDEIDPIWHPLEASRRAKEWRVYRLNAVISREKRDVFLQTLKAKP